MKRIVRLTESDIERIVKRVIKESFDDMDWIKDVVDSTGNRFYIDSHEDLVKHAGDTKWVAAKDDSVGKKWYDMYVKHHGPFVVYINDDKKAACQGDKCYRGDDASRLYKAEEIAEYLGVSSLDDIM